METQTALAAQKQRPLAAAEYSLYMGLDVHEDTIAIAVAAAGHYRRQLIGICLKAFPADYPCAYGFDRTRVSRISAKPPPKPSNEDFDSYTRLSRRASQDMSLPYRNIFSGEPTPVAA